MKPKEKTTFIEYEIDGYVRNLGSRNVIRKKLGLLSNRLPCFMPEYSNGFSVGNLPPNNKIYEAEYFMGGVSSFKKDVVTNIKFSEYFEGYGLYEDLEYCLRVSKNYKLKEISSNEVWYEEFLDYKIVIGEINSTKNAIEMINKYSGGHSSAIITDNQAEAQLFMENLDTAAVYHNASTRFTDGGQLGLGGELAISTDKLHQRGPIGLKHLVTNKWYVHGNGQIR